jgi:hypothetical protein
MCKTLMCHDCCLVCFTKTIQFLFQLVLSFFSTLLFNRLVSVLAGLTSANLDRQFSDFVEVSEQKHSKSFSLDLSASSAWQDAILQAKYVNCWARAVSER